MIAFRRDLHQHPELQFEEFRTTEKVAAVLDQLGITYRKTEPTGLIAEIVGGKPKPSGCAAGGYGCLTCTGIK